MTHPPPCWICGAIERKPSVVLGERLTLRCASCGMAHVWPMPSEQDLSEIYRKPLETIQTSMDKDRWGKELLRNRLLDWIHSLSPTGRLLDVGCGWGFFMETARSRGWEVEGIDVYRPKQEYATRMLRLKVADQGIDECHYPDNNFDVVTLWGSLDYMADPHLVLSEIYRVLKPGGWLWVRCNNARFHLPALRLASWLPFRWLALKPGIMHLHAFTPRNLSMALRKKGFRGLRAFPSMPTRGDIYKTGGRAGAWFVALSKAMMRTAAGLVYGLFRGVISSSFVIEAQKPCGRPVVLHIITRLDTGGSAENVIYSINHVDSNKYYSVLATGKTDQPTHILLRHPIEVSRLKRAGAHE